MANSFTICSANSKRRLSEEIFSLSRSGKSVHVSFSTFNNWRWFNSSFVKMCWIFTPTILLLNSGDYKAKPAALPRYRLFKIRRFTVRAGKLLTPGREWDTSLSDNSVLLSLIFVYPTVADVENCCCEQSLLQFWAITLSESFHEFDFPRRFP